MSLTKDILGRDEELFFNDLNITSKSLDNNSETKLIADFTEYNPLHNGHFHCMKVAKSQVPDALFVAIVPGLFERSGRGIPYILPREIRAKLAISVGADVVVEGPPMGIMGSGQYSLSLAKMFKALNTDYIPRGYKEVPNFDLIMDRISEGHWIAPKPYKIIDKTVDEVLLRDKLEEDNYVIASFSNSLSKINFDYKNKFIFVKRIEGVSGTLIRQSIVENNFDKVKDMMPDKTIEVLKHEIANDNLIYNVRDEEAILKKVDEIRAEKADAKELLALIGGDELEKIFEKYSIEAIIDTLIQEKKTHSLYEDDENGLTELEGLLNKKITGKLGKFYMMKPEYIISLPPEEQEHMAESISEGNIDLKNSLI